MRRLMLTLALLGTCLGLGCQVLRSTPKPFVPRPDQKQWVDETAVINLVTRLVYEARFESRRPIAERQYATLIRRVYAQTSSGGDDVDGGVRAVNFVHKIHHDAKGSRDLWRSVLNRARDPEPGQDGLTLPTSLE